MKRTISTVSFLLVIAACSEDGASTPTTTTTATMAPTTSSSTTTVAAEDDAQRPAFPFPLEATIPELQEAMEAGVITSADLVDFSLARIAAYDTAGPELNALITVNPRAREEAEALDAERAASGPRGPLHGIPVVVKDNINTTDMPTTAGSVALEGFHPSDDAFQVRRLREAGAVIIAKANLMEFAWGWNTRSSLGGQTLSPYDLSRDPGGSSGGTAVAVTANFATVGLGTDSCGSVRLPAAHNNLYGLRPTYGLSSRAGVIPLGFSLDTVGPMARSVIDLAILVDVTAGVDPDDPTTVAVGWSLAEAVDPDGLRGRRIGVLGRYSVGGPEVDATLQAALDELTANGAEVIRVTTRTGSVDHVNIILTTEFHFGLDEYLAAYPDAPVGSMDEIVDQGLLTGFVAWRDAFGLSAPLDAAAYHEAIARRAAQRIIFRDMLVAFMDDNDLDAIAYPTSDHPALAIRTGQDGGRCATASMAGLPALTVPVGFTSDGLPVGLEFMGRPFDEPTLIAIAAGYEAHTDHRRLPTTTPPLDSSK